MRRRPRRHSYLLRTWWKYLLLIIFTAVVLFPLFWIVLQSLKGHFDAIAVPPKFIFEPTLENYRKVFATTGFLRSFLDFFFSLRA